MSDNKGATDQKAADTAKDTPKTEPAQAANETKQASTEGLDAIKKELAESRDRSAKLQDKLDLIERQTAEKSGDLKKVLEIEKQSKTKLQQEFNDLKSQVVEAKIKSAIQEKAKDAHNVDHLMKLGDLDKVTVLKGEVYGVDEFVAGLRKSAPHLFKVQDINAGPKADPTGKPKELGDDYYKQLEKATTREQLAKVRKDFGVFQDGPKMMVDGQLQ